METAAGLSWDRRISALRTFNNSKILAESNQPAFQNTGRPKGKGKNGTERQNGPCRFSGQNERMHWQSDKSYKPHTNGFYKYYTDDFPELGNTYNGRRTEAPIKQDVGPSGHKNMKVQPVPVMKERVPEPEIKKIRSPRPPTVANVKTKTLFEDNTGSNQKSNQPSSRNAQQTTPKKRKKSAKRRDGPPLMDLRSEREIWEMDRSKNCHSAVEVRCKTQVTGSKPMTEEVIKSQSPPTVAAVVKETVIEEGRRFSFTDAETEALISRSSPAVTFVKPKPASRNAKSAAARKRGKAAKRRDGPSNFHFGVQLEPVIEESSGVCFTDAETDALIKKIISSQSSPSVDNVEPETVTKESTRSSSPPAATQVQLESVIEVSGSGAVIEQSSRLSFTDAETEALMEKISRSQSSSAVAFVKPKPASRNAKSTAARKGAKTLNGVTSCPPVVQVELVIEESSGLCFTDAETDALIKKIFRSQSSPSVANVEQELVTKESTRSPSPPTVAKAQEPAIKQSRSTPVIEKCRSTPVIEKSRSTPVIEKSGSTPVIKQTKRSSNPPNVTNVDTKPAIEDEITRSQRLYNEILLEEETKQPPSKSAIKRKRKKASKRRDGPPVIECGSEMEIWEMDRLRNRASTNPSA